MKSTATAFGSALTTVRKILKEKAIFQDVKGGPYPKIRLSNAQKLTVQQKDSIREAVIIYILAKLDFQSSIQKV